MEQMGPHCKNYWLCNSDYDDHPGGTRAGVKKLCYGCDIVFGKELTLVGEMECPVCFEARSGVVQPKCNHVTCLECFKRMRYGDEDLDNEPKFPYSSEIEEEYWETQDEDPKWELDLNIIRWNEEWNAWDDARQPSANLQICPICRS